MPQVRNATDIGALLRARRKARGLTQAQVAALAGVSPRFLSEVERGRESAGLGLVLRLCARLALDVEVIPREEHPS